MARMSRKEKIWEEFARSLADAISHKFFDEHRVKAKQVIDDAEQDIITRVYGPLKATLNRLPEGVVVESVELCIAESVETSYPMVIKLPEKCRVPRRLITPKHMLEALEVARRAEAKLSGEAHRLWADLFNNIIVAESFEEVVTKWPEAKELAEEVSLTCATQMNVPLAKILGRYAPTALPAPAVKEVA